MKNAKTLLLHSSKNSKQDLQIFKTLPFSTSLYIKPYTKNIILNYQRLLTNNKASTFIHKLDDKFIIGRSYDGEIIDFLQFDVLEWTINIKKYETGGKYILITNFDNDRLRNLFVDLFGFKGDKICVEAIKYLFTLKCDIELNDILGTNKKNQVEEEVYNEDIVELKDTEVIFNGGIQSINDSTSHLLCKLKLRKFWFCDAKVFKDAIHVEIEKKEKNVFTNEMGDVMGKIHIEKQELREIVLKKPRKIKNKE